MITAFSATDTPGPEPAGRPPARRLGGRSVARRLAALGLAACLAALASGCSSPASAPHHAVTASPGSAGTPTGPAPRASQAARPGPSASPAGLGSAYLPLYPFASQADALAWETAFRSGGHQPWHLSATQTALSFAQGYLGFTAVNLVTGATVRPDDARIAVGSAITMGRTSTAAVIHLIRFGTGSLAPWEVVGTDDTDFSLTSPAYGSAVSSPLRVGGLITGVEDRIHVQVRELDAAAPLADSCCHGAVSGTGQPWSATIAALPGGPDRVLTVVAWHDSGLSAVGRFAVTGLRAPAVATTSYTGPHFRTPEAAMRYLAAAYNANNRG
jgi:hypothetical protein